MTDILSQSGIVQSIDGDQAVIAVAAQGCSGCGKRSACGIGRLTGSEKMSLVRLPTPPGLTLSAGDRVRIEMAQAALNRAAVLAYLLPALLLVAGAVAGAEVTGSDGGAAAGAGAGMLLGWWLPRLLGRRSGRDQATPTIVREVA